MKMVTAYQCDSCGKVLKHKSSARRHEKECKHNPETKACPTCRYQELAIAAGGGGYDETPYEYFVSACSSEEAAADEEHYFNPQESPFYFVRHCPHHRPKPVLIK